jgi:hypothetical protein
MKFIPHRCLLPKGIHKMKKYDLVMTIKTLEYFIPTSIVVHNKYDKVNKQLTLNYLNTKVENGSCRLRNKTREYLGRMLEQLGESSWNVLQYAINTELTDRFNRRSILPYVADRDILVRLNYHKRVIDSLEVRLIRIVDPYYTDFT